MHIACPHCRQHTTIAADGRGTCTLCGTSIVTTDAVAGPATTLHLPGATPPPAGQAVRDEPTTSWVGRDIASCRIVSELGSGGMGRVYLAHHPGLNKMVAIKVLKRDLVTHSEAVERFMREAQSAARLEQPNVVQILHAGREGADNFIVMQHVEGESLAAMLERDRPLEPDTVLRIAVQVARALTAAHALGIIHRDIKPDNIMLTESGAVKVADFGLARDLSAPSELTVSGAAYGTPPYMAPEQIAGRTVDERSDLYALGVVLYECLCGERPFEADDFYGFVEQHLHRPPPRLRRHVPGLREEIDDLVHQLLAKQPADRYASAQELLDDLQRLTDRAPSTDQAIDGRRLTRSISGSARLHGLLSRAITEGATDIHIEPLSDGARVRFRVRGVLRRITGLSVAAGRGLVDACRSAAGIDGDGDEPSDGLLEFPHEGSPATAS